MALRYDIDLVILGGNVAVSAQRLLQETLSAFSCPVLSVGPHVQTANYQPSTIVYATDLSSTAHSAASLAFSWAQEYQSRLTLLHIIDGWALGGNKSGDNWSRRFNN